jgi:flagellum-specific peptidoglycan hydrolase FlgJ
MVEFQLHRQPEQETTLKGIFGWIARYWFQLVISLFLFHIYFNRDVQVIVGQGTLHATGKVEKMKANLEETDNLTEFSMNAMLPEDPPIMEDKPARLPGQRASADFKNLTFVLNPDLARKKNVDEAIVREKMANCRRYVERFAATAMEESRQFGIPASIKLAQGLLETDAGGSRLATESNNHFGIKCRSKCRGCTCRNYSDDDVFDMFRVFDSAWESYREHSKLLEIDRYNKLKKLGTTDFEAWAKGLKKAGYATDKNYDKKLIQIIEALDLHQFDK